MATLTTKYSIGDTVFHASTVTENKRHACPDCIGLRKWKVTSPAGADYEIACPRCSTRFLNDRDLSLDYSAYAPFASRLTIGSIQVNTAPGSHDHGNRYMCVQTGVGSGSIYDEARLFETEAEALAAAQAMADEQNAKTKWIVEQYNKALDISEYQLDNAKIKMARDAKSEASSLLWNIDDLFETIREATDKDAILEAIEDYKTYYRDGDREKVMKAILAEAEKPKVEEEEMAA